jgi:hypothetical protein
MVVVRPGALISDAAGSVGGVTFQRHGASLMVRARVVPTRQRSAANEISKNLHTTAKVAWGALTEIQRASWRSASRGVVRPNPVGQLRAMSGYGLFVGCYMRQAGNPTIVAPVLAGAIAASVPVEVRFALDGLDLKCGGFDRDLVTGEQAQLRVMDLATQSRSRPRYALHRTVCITSDEGLGGLLECSQLGSGVGSYLRRNGLYYNGVDYTFEWWMRLTGTAPSANESPLGWGTTEHRLNFSATAIAYYDGANWRTIITAAQQRDVWRYWAFVVSGTTGKADLYRDGAHYGVQVTNVSSQIDTSLTVMDRKGLGFSVRGDIDELRVSKVCRSAPEILANWNGGKGRLMVVDADTRGHYALDTLVAGEAVDDSGNGLNLTAVNFSTAPGAFNRLLYAGNECPWLSTRRVWVDAQTGILGLWTGKALRSYYDWP